MIFLTANNEPAEGKPAKKKFKDIAIISTGGVVILVLAILGIGSLSGGNDQPAASSSVTGEAAAPAPTKTAVPTTDFTLNLKASVFDKTNNAEAYRVIIVNQTSGKVVLEKDFPAGEDMQIQDKVSIPNDKLGGAILPAYAVGITSASGKHNHVVTNTKWAPHSSGEGKAISLEIVTKGSKMETFYTTP